MLLSSATAYAYLSPEQVFEGIDYLPTKRDAQQVVEDDAARRAAIREEEQQELIERYNPPAVQPSSESAHEAAPDQPVIVEADGTVRPSALTDEGRYQIREDRLSGSDQNGTVIIIQNGEAVIRDRQTGTVLHSGAPLVSRTGPSEVMALVALFVAASGTFWLVSKKQKAI